MTRNYTSYQWVEPERKIELIRRVNAGQTIKAAARKLNIKYSNAKAIVQK